MNKPTKEEEVMRSNKELFAATVNWINSNPKSAHIIEGDSGIEVVINAYKAGLIDKTKSDKAIFKASVDMMMDCAEEVLTSEECHKLKDGMESHRDMIDGMTVHIIKVMSGVEPVADRAGSLPDYDGVTPSVRDESCIGDTPQVEGTRNGILSTESHAVMHNDLVAARNEAWNDLQSAWKENG